MAKEKKEKKRFWDTKFGKILKGAGEGVVDVVEVVGKVKNGDIKGAFNTAVNALQGSDKPEAKEALTQLRIQEMEIKLELERVELEEFKAVLEDKQSARGMYVAKNAMADKVARQVINWNLPAIALLVVIEVLCVIYMDDKTLIAIISSAIGSVLTALINERLTVIQFFFGSSMGSKEKQGKLNEMQDNNMRKR